MKAIVFRETGGADVLEQAEVDTPKPGPGQVLVKVMATSLNHLDIWARKGAFSASLPMPHISGCDVCGIVADSNGNTAGLDAGTRVIVSPAQACGNCECCRAGKDSLCAGLQVLGFQLQGGYCEYVVADARDVVPVSNALGYEEWAALPLVYLTAYHMLFGRARIEPGETALVHACGSGVGVAAIQLAKLAGARVVTTSSSDDKLRRAREQLGADETINYRTGDLAKAVLERTGGRGVDVVIDSVGAALYEANIAVLRKGGRFVNCGVTSGATTEFQFRPVYARQISILGSYLGDRPELDRVVGLAEARSIRPVIDRVYRLEHAAHAQRRMENRESFGKIILTLD